MLNVRAGFTRDADKPPQVWFSPLKSDDREYMLSDYYQTTRLTDNDIDRLLDDYYDERDYDSTTGAPRIEKLSELGLLI